MWESTFSPDNKEIKRGLEGESSYNKSLVQKYKTMKQDIARQADEAVSNLPWYLFSSKQFKN
jgi:hypothetical protein